MTPFQRRMWIYRGIALLLLLMILAPMAWL
jgi:hypothetical protein